MNWRAHVDSMAPVALAELDEAAALQRRFDRKYIVPREVWGAVAASCARDTRVLEIDGKREFAYASAYFDTPAMDSYLGAARARPRRFKVRTRRYESGATAIEVKLRSGRGETVKHREWLAEAPANLGELTPEARDFVRRHGPIGAHEPHLELSLITAYTRTTLLREDGRVTVDDHVRGSDADGNVAGFGDALIVETKSAGGAGQIDRALWAMGVRPTRVSKYCTTLAALRPELPANRWHRTLHRHVTRAANQGSPTKGHDHD